MKNLLLIISILVVELAYCQSISDNNLVEVFVDEFEDVESSDLYDKWLIDDYRKYISAIDCAPGSHYSRIFAAYRTYPNWATQFALGNYDPDPVRLLHDDTGSGKLTMLAVKEDFVNYGKDICSQTEYDEVTYKWTAPAKLRSKKAFKYGYFEIRCRIPKITKKNNMSGIGPNFWLSGHTHGSSPASDLNEYTEEGWSITDHYAEIDIFEFTGKHGYGGDLTVNAHVRCPHSHPFDPELDQYGEVELDLSGNPILDTWASFGNTSPQDGGESQGYVHDGQYHTYAVLWLPEKLEFYKDGEVIAFTDFFGLASHLLPRSMVVDMNVFYSGAEPNNYTMDVVKYEIDWVRVWRLNMENCSDSYVGCDLSQIQNSVYSSIEIGGNSCSFQVGVGEEKDYWVSKRFNIERNVKFKIADRAKFKIDFTKCHNQIEMD